MIFVTYFAGGGSHICGRRWHIGIVICLPFFDDCNIIFQFVKTKIFVNNIINKISSLSLLVYIIHENILVRTYIRPQIWIFIYEKYGYSRVVLWVLLHASTIFVLAILVSWLYKISIERIIYGVSDRLYKFIICTYEKNIIKLMQK